MLIWYGKKLAAGISSFSVCLCAGWSWKDPWKHCRRAIHQVRVCFTSQLQSIFDICCGNSDLLFVPLSQIVKSTECMIWICYTCCTNLPAWFFSLSGLDPFHLPEPGEARMIQVRFSLKSSHFISMTKWSFRCIKSKASTLKPRSASTSSTSACVERWHWQCGIRCSTSEETHFSYGAVEISMFDYVLSTCHVFGWLLYFVESFGRLFSKDCQTQSA